MPSSVFTTPIALRQPEPPEGRMMFPLGQGTGGGDGLNFATGAEIFAWDTSGIPGPQKPSAIMGAWIDATNLTAGKNLIIKTPYQTFVFAGGNQGYIPITVPAGRFSVQISSNGGMGTVSIIFYNYNAAQMTGAPGAAVSGGGNYSGSGNYGGGGSPGGGESPPKPGSKGGPTY